jgi:GNAT superfamily N-acetyltransferase
MNVRKANLNDTLILAQLMTQLGYPTTADEMQQRLEIILQKEDYQTLVAVTDNVIVGVIGMLKMYLWELAIPAVKIQVLVVSEEHRGGGVGKCLIEAAELWAKEQGANQLILTSGNREERTIAHKFYPSMGFELTSSGYKKEL